MSTDEIQQSLTDFVEEITKGYAAVVTILCSDGEPTVMIHGTPNIGAVTIGGWVVNLNETEEEDE